VLGALTLTERICSSGDRTSLNPIAQKPSAAALAQLFEPIRDDLRQVEKEFARHVQSQVALIPTIGNYIQDGGGKRIRPAVLLMAARMSGYTGERAVLYASVIEFIHTATLVHDDIIDESDLRRGREAVHTRWGNHVTVLFGDFLYLKSMSLALTQDCLEIIRLLCDVTLRIVEGEIYQLTKNGVVDLSEEEHFDILRRKTAFLFAGSAKIGAMLGPTTREQQEALWDYGLNIGMAFQIVDDLLDFTGEEEALGKPVGGDLREGKMTLPLIHLYSRGEARAQRLIRQVIDARNVTLEEWREIRGLLAQARSLDYAQRIALEFVERAKKALCVFPPSDALEALLFLPDYVISRDR
jgi:octaprenyl-diphosphate synthase